jgi:germination protein M
MRSLLCIVPIALVAAACGGQSRPVTEQPVTTSPPTTTAVTTTVEQLMSLELFFLARDGKLVAASRSVERTEAPGGAALRELITAPAGASTQVPDGLRLTIVDGKARVTGSTLEDAALAQIVYTLTSFPTVQVVNGKTRADVEDFAPAILVEHPTAGEAVTSPLHVTGTANTFEATFNYRLEDASGDVLAKDFVTATSGSGTRGTFEFTVPFDLLSAQNGTLAVFELSAEDGSVIHERDIPLRLAP